MSSLGFSGTDGTEDTDGTEGPKESVCTSDIVSPSQGNMTSTTTATGNPITPDVTSGSGSGSGSDSASVSSMFTNSSVSSESSTSSSRLVSAESNCSLEATEPTSRMSATNYRPAVALHLGAGVHSARLYNKYKRLSNAACRKAMTVLDGAEPPEADAAPLNLTGCAALRAAVAACEILENSEITNAGYGSNLNIRGEVECDASVLVGRAASGPAEPSFRSVPVIYSSVTGVNNILNPVRLCAALLASRESLRDSSASSGFRAFPTLVAARDLLPKDMEIAGSSAFPLETVPNERLVTPAARALYLYWKRTLGLGDKSGAEGGTKGGAEGDAEEGTKGGTDGKTGTNIDNHKDSNSGSVQTSGNIEQTLADLPESDVLQQKGITSDTVCVMCIDRQGFYAVASSSGGAICKRVGRVGCAALAGGGFWGESFTLQDVLETGLDMEMPATGSESGIGSADGLQSRKRSADNIPENGEKESCTVCFATTGFGEDLSALDLARSLTKDVRRSLGSYATRITDQYKRQCGSSSPNRLSGPSGPSSAAFGGVPILRQTLGELDWLQLFKKTILSNVEAVQIQHKPLYLGALGLVRVSDVTGNSVKLVFVHSTQSMILAYMAGDIKRTNVVISKNSNSFTYKCGEVKTTSRADSELLPASNLCFGEIIL